LCRPGSLGEAAQAVHAGAGRGAASSNAAIRDCAPSSHLAHHFESPIQQHEAAKLGMWLFLATEILLFGGLFCLYAVFRANRPETFEYGSQFLDTGWGAINTVVLIVSSLTMAMAVWCAQTGHQRGLVIFLGLTLICATDFLGVKIIEYSHKFHDNLVWGMGFYESPLGRGERAPAVEPIVEPAVELLPGDAALGRKLFRFTCAGCHGATGAGLPNSGKPLTTSTFVSGLDDTELLAFLKVGRPVKDPLNTTGIAMLPRGGNPRLSDQDLVHIVEYLNVLQSSATQASKGPATPTADEVISASSDEEFIIPKTFIPEAVPGPSGLSIAALGAFESGARRTPERVERPDPRRDPDRPANAHLFFGLYFLMTGLHGLHVLVGIAVITWLLVRALRGEFSHRYFTPVDLGGLYWHVVDVIWIFLFPLLYLIR
jgi:cytochrome c oxidase subunit III